MAGHYDGPLDMPIELIYPFDGLPDGSTIVDIGGGNGQNAIRLVKSYPQLAAIVQDHVSVISNAENMVKESYREEIASRTTWEAHDYYAQQPQKGADIYLLSHVLMDNSDEKCVKMIQEVAKVMDPAKSKLLIHDFVDLPRTVGEGARLIEMLDLHLIASLNTHSRTELEFDSIIERAAGDLGLARVKTWPGRGSAVLELRLQSTDDVTSLRSMTGPNISNSLTAAISGTALPLIDKQAIVNYLGALAAGVIVLFLSLIAVHHLFTKLHAYIILRHIPGPPLAHLSSWLHRRAILRYTPAQWYHDVIEKYVAKIAPNLIVTSSPEVWMHVTTKPGYPRSEWFFRAMRVDYQHDHLFSLTDTAEHDRRRKLLGPGFHGTECSYELCINERLEELLLLIRSKYLSSDSKVVPMDIAAKVQYFTHDVITAITFGKSFEMVQKDADTNGYIKSIKEGFLTANILVAFGLAKISQSSLIGPALTPVATEETGY
ncbi:cytochrome P450 monooxygenase, putative [Trichophyton verrucosum HKI 0517]|uniref:Cytochrome P450 monooxygenase, putative n=1 Tax=Trichophyton verrucosum (strain HKI 0517) TaxID=663202 RepID=D4DCN0_TRIVH|nr:cytochrome P450 monooxygenase, putative [Trichophyton verrucosum HKI 0517]EFE40402.1 cytochrome P450 monooxygenase, putative [Trichophyton verrucosum HKI 0517]